MGDKSACCLPPCIFSYFLRSSLERRPTHRARWESLSAAADSAGYLMGPVERLPTDFPVRCEGPLEQILNLSKEES